MSIKTNIPVKSLTYNGEPVEISYEGYVSKEEVDLLMAKNDISGHYENDWLTIARQDLFIDNTTVTSVYMPNITILNGAGGAFNACTALETINLPKLTSAGRGFCQGATALKNVYLPLLKSLGNGYFRNCTSLKKVVFESVTSTGSTDIFSGTCGVEVADFYVLDTLAYGGLKNSANLHTLIIRTPTVCKSTYANPLSGTPIADGEGFIYVPDNLVEAYKIQTNLNVYANQYKPLSELPEEIKLWLEQNF